MPMKKNTTLFKILFLTFVSLAPIHWCYSAEQTQAVSDTTLSPPALIETTWNFLGRCNDIEAIQRFAREGQDPASITRFFERLRDSIGLISFVSDREWTISGDGIIQIWSDAVQATRCNKQTMRGDVGASLWVIDCRSNPDHSGDLFTWCAVAHFASELCPAPWRVPTAEDFCNLNKILFDQSSCRTHTVEPKDVIETYIERWGGAFGGSTASRGTLFFQEVKGYYWSISEYDENYAFYLDYDVHGKIQPQCTASAKAVGLSLRCIRDGE